MLSSLGLPLVDHVVGGEDGVYAISRKRQERGFDDAAGGVGGDAGGGEDDRRVADAEGRCFVRRRGASAHRLSESGRRRAEEGESCYFFSAREVVIEHSGRDQVARHVNASQAVRRLPFMADAGGLHDGAARGDLQQGREVRLGLNGVAADGDAQCRLSGGPRVQGAPADVSTCGVHQKSAATAYGDVMCTLGE